MSAVETPVKFDRAAALKAANDAVRERIDQLHEQMGTETQEALASASAYAKHLADGGDPTSPPGVAAAPGISRGYRSSLVPEHVALLPVAILWNEARGSRNPLNPLHDRGAYWIAETLFGRFGEAVTYAELSKVSGRSRSLSAPEVQKSVVAIAHACRGEVVPRKTKVDGKVAYLIRDRRDDDPDVYDAEYQGGVWRPGPGLFYEVPEEKKP